MQSLSVVNKAIAAELQQDKEDGEKLFGELAPETEDDGAANE